MIKDALLASVEGLRGFVFFRSPVAEGLDRPQNADNCLFWLVSINYHVLRSQNSLLTRKVFVIDTCLIQAKTQSHLMQRPPRCCEHYSYNWTSMTLIISGYLKQKNRFMRKYCYCSYPSLFYKRSCFHVFGGR